MWRLALRSSLAKKMRLLSTALAVILGVAFLAGTLVFTDTIQRTFDDLFADVFRGTDAYVRSTTTVETPLGSEQRGRIPEDVVDAVRATRGVADAQAVVQGFAQVVGADGRAIGEPGRGAPTFAMTYVGGEQSPWRLTEGSRAPGPGELVVDNGTADAGHLRIGDPVTILTQSGPHELTLVGTARFGSVDSPGGASVALIDLATSQQVLLGGPGEIDAVMVAAQPGVSQAEVAAAIDASLPEGAEVLTGAAITAEAQDTMREAMGFFGTFLLVFAAVGLVVACFTIYNTFQIVVTQRTREMALLRSLGATSRQVLGVQMLEAVLVGLVASVIGLFGGVLVAGLLKGMLVALGIDIPTGAIVLRPRTVVVAMVVGTLVTIVSAVFPSLRAAHIPPLAALRDVATERTHQSGRRLVVGGLPLVAGLGCFVAGLAGGELAFVGLGALLVFVGVFTLGPLLASPAMRLLGAPLPAVSGVTGELARENALRNPKRTARTGGALMVGVALVASIAIIAATAKDWTRDIVGSQFSGDVVVSTDLFGVGGLDPTVAAAIARLPEVDTAAGVRVGGARNLDADRDLVYVAVDPAAAAKVFDIGVVTGSLADLSPDGLLVDDDEAAHRGLEVGDVVELGFLDGSSRAVTVEGIYSKDDLAGRYVVHHALHEASGADQFDFSIYVSAAPGTSVAEAAASIAAVTEPYANADVQTRSEYIDSQASQIDQIVNLMYGLLALAVVIALFSIANSMVLSVHERTREIGLLRAVGMTRRQVRTSVTWEAVLIGLLGALLGIAVGCFFGWSISVTLRNEGLGDAVLPFRPLAVLVVLAVLGAVLAAARPSWRASRLDVLGAISAE